MVFSWVLLLAKELPKTTEKRGEKHFFLVGPEENFGFQVLEQKKMNIFQRTWLTVSSTSSICS